MAAFRHLSKEKKAFRLKGCFKAYRHLGLLCLKKRKGKLVKEKRIGKGKQWKMTCIVHLTSV